MRRLEFTVNPNDKVLYWPGLIMGPEPEGFQRGIVLIPDAFPMRPGVRLLHDPGNVRHKAGRLRDAGKYSFCTHGYPTFPTARCAGFHNSSKANSSRMSASRQLFVASFTIRAKFGAGAPDASDSQTRRSNSCSSPDMP